MRTFALRTMNQLRESYWFIPAIMASGALLAALLMVYVDSHFGSTWMDRLPWLYAARPSGARNLLSAVGGSMIGVAGTTFSVTIAAVVYASGQYGPRLLSNFMADRGNQVTLGTFIATFLYSMVVLRTIRSPGENGSGAGAFVPQLALIVAFLLVLASVGVLIYFIHHVPQRIHINSVIEEVGDRLLREIDNRFPAFIGDPVEEEDDRSIIPAALRQEPGEAPGRTVAVEAKDTGYIQVIDDEALIDIAREHDLILRLRCRPGDFARRGSVLIQAWPSEECDEDTQARLRRVFAFGSRRTPLQDLRFLIDELVEIAARALSPGVNDPFTANSCLDWLGAALAELARRSLPSDLRKDEAGALRVIAPPLTFALLTDRALGALAQYASADRIAGEGFLDTIESVAAACRRRDRLAVLHKVAADFRGLAEHNLAGASRRLVCARADELLAALHPKASA